MAPNSSADDSWPFTWSDSWYAWSLEEGAWPTLPAPTWTFCSSRAASTSGAVRPRRASSVGSNHRRMAKRRSPKMRTSPTPFTRSSASRMYTSA
ncbi:hypothetical protein COSO111634_35835 [Corallococcus soli]